MKPIILVHIYYIPYNIYNLPQLKPLNNPHITHLRDTSLFKPDYKITAVPS